MSISFNTGQRFGSCIKFQLWMVGIVGTVDKSKGELRRGVFDYQSGLSDVKP